MAETPTAAGVSGTQGQLYIQVISVSNVSFKGEVFCNLTLDCETNQTTKFRTKETSPVEGSIYWFKEYLMEVPDCEQNNLLIHVKGKKLFKNRHLGDIQIPINTITEGSIHDKHIKLTENASGEHIDLHIKLSFKRGPLSTNRARRFNLGLGQMRTVLEKEVYQPGETVRGVLVCNLPMKKKIPWIELIISGAQICWWTETHGSGDNRHTDTYREEIVFFYNSLRFFPESSADAGENVWPFEFTIPLQVPPSFRAAHAWCNYLIRAKTPGKGVFKIPKVKSREITVITPPPSVPMIEVNKAQGDKYNEGQVSLNLHVEQPCYIGENLSYTVTIVNNSSEPVQKMIVEIRGLVTAHASHLRTIHTRNQLLPMKKCHIQDESCFPVLPGETKTLTVNMKIPHNLPPTIPQDVAYIASIEYTLAADLIIFKSFAQKVKVRTPVILTRRPTEQYKLYDTPLGQLYEIRTSKANDLKLDIPYVSDSMDYTRVSAGNLVQENIDFSTLLEPFTTAVGQQCFPLTNIQNVLLRYGYTKERIKNLNLKVFPISPIGDNNKEPRFVSTQF